MCLSDYDDSVDSADLTPLSRFTSKSVGEMHWLQSWCALCRFACLGKAHDLYSALVGSDDDHAVGAPRTISATVFYHLDFVDVVYRDLSVNLGT